jgi:hypothetical protein
MPGFFAEGLVNSHTRRLEIKVKLFDLGCGFERDGGGEQIFFFSNALDEDGLIHMTQRQEGLIPAHLRVERRVPVDEVDGETELLRVEAGGDADIVHKELCSDRSEGRPGLYLRHRVEFPLPGSSPEIEPAHHKSGAAFSGQ